MASTTVKCTPQNLNVTPLSQRRAELSWSKVNVPSATLDKFFVQVARIGGNFPTTTPVAVGPNVHDTGKSEEYEIDLDKVFNSGSVASPTLEGLAHARAYKLRVAAEYTMSSDKKTFFSDPIVVIDIPITRVNGYSPGTGTNDGMAKLMWTSVEDVLMKPEYGGGDYSIRTRVLGDSGGHHSGDSWKPDNPGPAMTVAVDSMNKHITDLTREEVNAIQLIYDVTPSGKAPIRFFGARDAYVWPSAGQPEPPPPIEWPPIHSLVTFR